MIGPPGNFSALPDAAQWVLVAGMLVSRLEFVTVFVLLTYHFWKDRTRPAAPSSERNRNCDSAAVGV